MCSINTERKEDTERRTKKGKKIENEGKITFLLNLMYF